MPGHETELFELYAKQGTTPVFLDRSDGEKKVNEDLLKEKLLKVKVKRWVQGALTLFIFEIIIALLIYLSW